VDLSQPGWKLVHGQAAWRFPSARADLAGELTAALHPDGSIMLEFTKTPLTLVIARLTPDAWQLLFVAEKRSYAGRGHPPARSAWLALALALSQRPLPKGWSWQQAASGEWRLENVRSGERLRGFLRP
jgi:hypothetical protein